MRRLAFYMNAFIEAWANKEIDWLFQGGQNVVVALWTSHLSSGEEVAVAKVKALCEEHKLRIRK